MSIPQELILGAAGVVATVSLGLLAYAQLRRSFPQPNVHLSAEFLPKSEAGIAFLVTLRNTGRHPAFIETLAIHLRNGTLVPFRGPHGDTISSPLQVTEEAPVRLHFPLSELMPEILSPLAVRCIEATSTAGKRYSFPGRAPWSRRAFQRHIRSRWTQQHQNYWQDRSQRDSV